MSGLCLCPQSPPGLTQVHLVDTNPKGVFQGETLHQSFFCHEPLENSWLLLEGHLRITYLNTPRTCFKQKALGPVSSLTTWCLQTHSHRKPQKINQLLRSNCFSLSHCHVASLWCYANYHHKYQSHFGKRGRTNSSRASQAKTLMQLSKQRVMCQ